MALSTVTCLAIRQTYDVWNHTSNVWRVKSYVKHMTCEIIRQTDDVWNHTSNIWRVKSYVKHMTCEIILQTYDVWNHTSNRWRVESYFKHMTCGIVTLIRQDHPWYYCTNCNIPCGWWSCTITYNWVVKIPKNLQGRIPKYSNVKLNRSIKYKHTMVVTIFNSLSNALTLALTVL